MKTSNIENPDIEPLSSACTESGSASPSRKDKVCYGEPESDKAEDTRVPDNPVRLWSRLSSEKIADCRVFTVHKTLSMRADISGKKTHDFYVFHSGDWVNVIPVTDDGRVLLIEQYRHGTEKITLEIPGGSIDPSDPSPHYAAERELLEETGFKADAWTHLGSSHPNPAIQSNSCHTFLARSINRVQVPKFESTEEIAIRLVDLDEIPSLIKSGTITHALVLVAFYWLRLNESQL